MTIDAVTAVQYTGFFHNPVRQTLEQGKVAEATEEAIFQRSLEEERKRIQKIADVRLRAIQHYMIEKDVKRKRAEYDELMHVDIFI